MKEILKKSLKLYGLTVVGGFLCIVLFFTFNVIGTSMFCVDIGYKVYDKKTNEFMYEHYYSDGEDTKIEQYVDKEGEPTVSKFNIPSKIPVGWQLFSQFCLISVMGVFVYNNLWKTGYDDSGAIRRGELREDKWKGLKIGLVATVVPVLVLAVVFIGRTSFMSNVTSATLGFLNPQLYPAITLLVNQEGILASEMAVWQFLAIFAMLFAVPLIATVSYILGSKSILVSEKLVYKKK